ncbi:MAG: hypothetical protein F6J93_15230 [Oscillatoria sp. SIO1A7]|nr:hypothetical protein [Oscillatoria sp. SIO1A7]
MIPELTAKKRTKTDIFSYSNINLYRKRAQGSASQGCGCSACESKKKAALLWWGIPGIAPASMPMRWGGKF